MTLHPKPRITIHDYEFRDLLAPSGGLRCEKCQTHIIAAGQPYIELVRVAPGNDNAHQIMLRRNFCVRCGKEQLRMLQSLAGENKDE